MQLLDENDAREADEPTISKADITTTKIYARGDAEMKRIAFEKINKSPVPTEWPPWHEEKE